MRSQFRCWAIIALVLLCTIAAFAAPTPWVVALDKAQNSGDPLVLVLQEIDGKLTGEVFLSKSSFTGVSADVSKLTRTDDTLKGDVTVALAADKTGSYTLEATVKDNVFTGTYKGKTGDTEVTGAVIWGADLLPMGQANFAPSSKSPIGWRGDGSGRFPGATPVTDWNLKTQKNVIWQTKLPFFSCSGPIVVGDKVFTTGEPDLLICLDAKTGKELWRRHNALFMEKIEEKERERLYQVCEDLLEIGEKWMRNPGEHEGKPNGDVGDPCNMLWVPTSDSRKLHLESSVKLAATKLGLDLDKIRAMFMEVGSGPKGAPTKLPKGKGLLNSRCYSWTGNMPATPASDGKVVITRVASENGWGYLVCYDLDGNRLWSVETGLTGPWNCPYDSPLIIDGKVISLAKNPADKSKGVNFVAYDLASGKTLWSKPTRSSAATPQALWLEGIPLIILDGSAYALADGTILGSMEKADADKLSNFCTPSIQGDLILDTIAGRKALPFINRVKWTEKGKILVYEKIFRGVNGDGGGIPFGWDRGSSVLFDSWIFKSCSGRDPRLFAYNSNVPYQAGGNYNKCVLRVTKPVLVPPKKGETATQYGPPSEDDMSMVMGGKFLFAAPSTWPSQFIVASAPPEVKVVGEPVMDAAQMGSPFFQGNRIFMRDFRYLYCFGDTTERDKPVVVADNKEVK